MINCKKLIHLTLKISKIGRDFETLIRVLISNLMYYLNQSIN